jgi:hypothetical protein
MSWNASCPFAGTAPERRSSARIRASSASRLGDVVVGAGVQGTHRILVLGARGDHDHRQVAGGRTAADLAAHLDAGDHRQHPVEQHQVRLRFGDAGQRLLPVGRFVNAKPLLFQIVAQHRHQRGFVLHQQYQWFGQAGHRIEHDCSPKSRVRSQSFGRTTA